MWWGSFPVGGGEEARALVCQLRLRSAWQEGAVARPLGSPSPQPFPILLPLGSGSLSCSAPAPRPLPAEASGRGTAPSSSLSKGAPETAPARKSGGLGIRWVCPSALAWGSVCMCVWCMVGVQWILERGLWGEGRDDDANGSLSSDRILFRSQNNS